MTRKPTLEELREARKIIIESAKSQCQYCGYYKDHSKLAWLIDEESQTVVGMICDDCEEGEAMKKGEQ